MIAKLKTSTNNGLTGQAGDAAERQMAHYLDRAFGQHPKIHVFNDLRVEHDREIAQLDHLVLHPYGMIVVESKSVSGKVVVNRHEEWTRHWGNGKKEGMASPIKQAERQIELLLRMLEAHREQLLDKIGAVIQSRFGGCPWKVLVAISDKGIIERKGIDPPELFKADHVCDEIEREIQIHHRSRRRLGIGSPKDYGIYRLNPRETERIVQFLHERHTPLRANAIDTPTPTAQRSAVPTSPPRKRTTQPAPAASKQVQTPPPPPPPPPPSSPPAGLRCKHCKSTRLIAKYGKYGYYFKCDDCEKNTPIDYACTACGTKGRIRKRGHCYDRVCSQCEYEEPIWANSKAANTSG